jgi:hypothetical protein
VLKVFSLSGLAIALNASTALAGGVPAAADTSANYNMYGKPPQAMAATPSPYQPMTHKKKKPKH